MTEHYLLFVGISLLNFIGVTLLIAWGSLLLNLSLQPYTVLISLLICILLLWRLLASQFLTNYVGQKHAFQCIMTAFFASLIISLLFAGVSHDFSYDGQNYQQEALIQLYQGWNPLWEPALSEATPYSLWINSYPKALWYFGAAVYHLTGLIETGKLFQGILLLGTLFITLSALRLFLKSNKICWLISLLLVANPVVVVQFFTFYIDGVLYLLLLTLIALAYIRHFFVKQEFCSVILDITIALTIIVLSNSKFTGLVYAGLFCSGWMCFTYFTKHNKPIIQLCILSLITSCLLVGYHPYITNLLDHGHPFWPLMGKNSADIMTPNEHPDFLKQNRLTKMIWSNMATGRNNADFSPAPLPEPRGVPELKLPFTFSQYELKLYESADIRIGGFGPWFGGILLCTVVFGGFLVLGQQKAQRAHFVFLITWLLLSILINPEAWWARYAPQLWLLPLITVIYAYYLVEISIIPKSKYFINLLLFILVFNSTLVLFISVREQVRSEYQLQRQLKIVNEYIATNKGPVLIDFSTFQANRQRFQEQGISYFAIDGGKTPVDIPFFQLAGSRTKVYISDQNLVNKLTTNAVIP